MENKTQWLWKLVMVVIFVFSVFHLTRDIMQALDIHNIFTDTISGDHEWCKPFGEMCQYMSFPPEILSIIIIPMIWRRKEIGILGWMVVLSPVTIFFMWLLP